MAKVKSPLFSLSASGMIGPRLTFSERKSGSQVRIQKAQKDRITPARTAQREKYSLGLDLWDSLSDNEKAYWSLMESQGFVEI